MADAVPTPPTAPADEMAPVNLGWRTSGAAMPRTIGQREWALTFQHSPIGMAIVHLDGTWGRVNQALCDMLGRPARELLSMTFQDLTHPDDVGEDLELLASCLNGERNGYRMTKRYVHSDGRTVWGDLSVALVRDDQEHPLYFVSQILDVTSQRQDRDRLELVLDQLRAANEDLQRFAGFVSHDLKMPLATVGACLELVEDELDGVDAALGALDLTRQGRAATERMGALIDALLAWTVADGRAEQSRDVEEVDLPSVVEHAAADIASVLERAHATVLLGQSVQDAPPVWGSRDLLRTLVVNVLSNAARHGRNGAPVQVQVEADAADDRVTLRIRNDGPSLPAAQRELVFDFLARGERAAAGIEGFGIGLAACRRIVSWHGGRIWIEEPVSGGVEVCCTLPLRQPRPEGWRAHGGASSWSASATASANDTG